MKAQSPLPSIETTEDLPKLEEIVLTPPLPRSSIVSLCCRGYPSSTTGRVGDVASRAPPVPTLTESTGLKVARSRRKSCPDSGHAK